MACLFSLEQLSFSALFSFSSSFPKQAESRCEHPCRLLQVIPRHTNAFLITVRRWTSYSQRQVAPERKERQHSRSSVAIAQPSVQTTSLLYHRKRRKSQMQILLCRQKDVLITSFKRISGQGKKVTRRSRQRWGLLDELAGKLSYEDSH